MEIKLKPLKEESGYIAYVGDKCIGHIYIVEQTKGYYWIHCFEIWMMYRGMRFGQQVLEKILTFDYLQGCKILLTVKKKNGRAIHIYKKFGFKYKQTCTIDKQSDVYELQN